MGQMDNKFTEKEGKKISFYLAMQIELAFLKNRNAQRLNQITILDIFNLKNEIYKYGKEQGEWK